MSAMEECSEVDRTDFRKNTMSLKIKAHWRDLIETIHIEPDVVVPVCNPSIREGEAAVLPVGRQAGQHCHNLSQK
jgi:hypothetical protein